MKSQTRSLPLAQCFEAATRLMQGEALEALAREYQVAPQELTRCRTRLEALLQKEARKKARKRALESTRERWVEDQIRQHLTSQGYVVKIRQRVTGPDILATKSGRTLLVEVKGDRPGHVSASATINVDVLTLLGQIVMAKAQRMADEYALAVRPVHMKLLEKALPVLQELGVTVLLVEDNRICVVTGILDG